MRIDFCTELTLPDGAVWLPDIEVELSVTVEFDGSEPTITIDDVLVDVSAPREPSRYVSMLGEGATPEMQVIGKAVLAKAKDSREVESEALEKADIHWIGHPNDPDGYWREAS